MQKCASGNTCEVDVCQPGMLVLFLFPQMLTGLLIFFFLICDFYYEQFGFGGEISEIM